MPSILVIEDKDGMRDMLAQTLEAEGYQVDVAPDGMVGASKAKEKRYDLVLTDLKLPKLSGLEVLTEIKDNDPEAVVVVMTAYGTVENAVEAMKIGAFDFLTKPFDTDHLTVLIKRALENRRLVAENILLREELAQNLGFDQVIGRSPAVQEVIKLVQKVAPSDTTVLFLGESGTGKELFARAIHNLSTRKHEPFVAINCAAIPHELLENELFGSEKGAYTGAVSRKMGKFEIAEGGTIFLDEVGDLDVALQAKLLRVLQEKKFERLGGTRVIEADVRVVAASNTDLKAAIEKKLFREDLFYRLSVFPITIPPLRERPEDIITLADHFILKYCREMKKKPRSLTNEAKRILEKYNWPGNVRELENTIERAIILCEGKKIKPEHLAVRIPTMEDIRLRSGAGLKDVGQYAQMEAEKKLIKRVLSETHGNKRKAAQILKIDYTTLFDKIKKYHIEPEGPKYGDEEE